MVRRARPALLLKLESHPLFVTTSALCAIFPGLLRDGTSCGKLYPRLYFYRLPNSFHDGLDVRYMIRRAYQRPVRDANPSRIYIFQRVVLQGIPGGYQLKLLRWFADSFEEHLRFAGNYRHHVYDDYPV